MPPHGPIPCHTMFIAIKETNMSTNARIGLKLDDNNIVSVYHHWDGYPEWLGKQLVDKYTTRDQIEELIDGGDISCIASDSDWNLNDVPEHVQYYSHRGEDCPPKLAESVSEYFEQCDNCGAEYGYVFEKGEWFVYNTAAWAGPVGVAIDLHERIARTEGK
ncbi:hypothetical protein SSSM5_063 [Synechococcus phage S-SSM5]|uniref:Uncharacterized protein n=1 Tax=Synechococcus phage S-SSM5 TaxID=445685 RepID=E3SKA3_9CAUD|nr:hypothetical protein SSSM5_063 [Synechococcus phage S-SSM5]ADO98007.1 hypothetical protein SSSM5_063 [Synechococcus phage S-SSM5]